MEHEERRRRRRFKHSWPIWVMQNEEEVAHGSIDNISRSGVYFRSVVPGSVEAGMTVSVRIGVPVGEGGASAPHTITGHARVVRLKQEESGCGVALHFSEELDPFGESEEGES